jgi:hypothetical protein
VLSHPQEQGGVLSATLFRVTLGNGRRTRQGVGL